MEHMHHAAGAAVAHWWKREHLWPGLALLVLTAIAWAYTVAQVDGMGTMNRPAAASQAIATDPMMAMDMPGRDMQGMGGVEAGGAIVPLAELALFLFGWVVMMVAMMLPAALPLILLYRSMARRQSGARDADVGMVVLLAGYIGVWALAGLPAYGYSLLAGAIGPAMAIVPGLLLIAGGVYQFTALKQGCHTRCSNPLFFLMQNWRPGMTGTLRLGLLHGVDCLGCCIGLMVALIALGMMNVAWMLTAAVIIFVEKTLPGGHRIAQPLGVVLILGGAFVLASLVVGSRMGM